MPSLACASECASDLVAPHPDVAAAHRLLRTAVLAGLVLGLGFGLINSYYSSGPALTPCQPDSLIYYQYARALAEGHPYRFTPDQAPSTGSTSHLYPAVLALGYALGARGEWLGVASFALGCLCLTLTLVSIVGIVRALRPNAGWLALALCGLSGHLLLSSLGESDMTLFVPLVLGAFAAALHDRTRAFAVLLFLASLCRPEGMMLSALCFAGALLWLLMGKARGWGRRYLTAAGIGMLGAVMALALNVILTGSPGFQSVAQKGHFVNFPLAGALSLTAEAFVAIFQDVFWGLNHGFRSMYTMPVIGGALALLGVAARPWRWTRLAFCETWMVCGALASVVLVASSGWSGLAYDRYFAWWIPLLLLYAAIGVDLVRSRAGAPLHWPLVIVLVGYQVMTLPYFVAAFISMNTFVASRTDFARTVHQQLEPGTSLGVSGIAGIAYYLPGRSVVNLSGIMSPAFVPDHHVLENVERLRHRPELRFDYWLLEKTAAENSPFAPLVGELLLDEVFSPRPQSVAAVYRPRWDRLNGGVQPAKPEILSAVQGLTLVDSLNVGYPAHERDHRRSVFTRLSSLRIAPFLREAMLEDQAVLEVGEAVIGSESFDLRAETGKPVRLVMRTLPSAEVEVTGADGIKQRQTYTLANPLRLMVQAGGRRTDIMEFPLTTETNHFDEIILDIPADFIAGPTTRITVGGDHVSCAFWAYQ